MSGGAVASLAMLALALLLPLLALRGRKNEFAKGWKIGALWVGLFLVAGMTFTWLGI